MPAPVGDCPRCSAQSIIVDLTQSKQVPLLNGRGTSLLQGCAT